MPSSITASGPSASAIVGHISISENSFRPDPSDAQAMIEMPQNDSPRYSNGRVIRLSVCGLKTLILHPFRLPVSCSLEHHLQLALFQAKDLLADVGIGRAHRDILVRDIDRGHRIAELRDALAQNRIAQREHL